MKAAVKRFFGEEFNNLLLLNLMTVGCSLGVITIGPALAALFGTLERILDGRCELNRKRTFWLLFKNNLRRGILAEFMVACYMLVMLWCFSLAQRLESGGQVLGVVTWAVSAWAAMVAIWFLMLLASVEKMPIKDALWNAICMVPVCLPKTLLATVIFYGILYAFILFYPVTLLPYLVVVISFAAALVVAILWQPLRQFVLPKWPDVDRHIDDEGHA